MTPPKPERLSTLDMVEAFHLGHAVSTLHELNIFESLKQQLSVEALAGKHRLDPDWLRTVLDYVAARTDLLRKTGKRFVVTRQYSNSSRFLLDLYTGGYGSNATQLAKLMRNPALAPATVDRDRHARAFESAEGAGLGRVPEVIKQLQFNHVLDIGCGSAALLLHLAEQDPEFTGWGLELNPSMCKAARKNIRSAQVGKRIKILQGDSRHLGTDLPLDVRGKVQAVTACQVVNEMFGKGISQAVAWLRGLRKRLPNKPLLICDYYGRLGSKIKCHHRETLLHDYAQMISGQGIPPANFAQWRTLYNEAGCRLVHVIEDKTTTRFIHILVL